MATHGEKRGHQRGDSVAAYGEVFMATVTRALQGQQGTQSDGTPLDMVGVIVCGVSEGRTSWARLYMEQVEQAGDGIESVVDA